MGFGVLDDGTGQIEFVVFPKTYEQHAEDLVVDNVLLMKGKLDEREDKETLIVDAIKKPEIDEQMPSPDNESVFELEIPRGIDKAILQDVGKTLKSHPGKDVIVLVIPNGSIPKKLKLPYTVDWTESVKNQVAELLSTV